MRRRALQPYRKKTMRWYFLYHGISCLLITKMLNFLEMKNKVFLRQKVDGNMIFTDYRKVLVLIFIEIGNTVFSWAEKLIERWYLLITEKVLFLTFWWWKIRCFFESRSWWKDDIYWLLRSSCFELFGDGKYGLFLSQEVDGKMIFTGYREVLVLNFSVMGKYDLFSAKKLMERWYLLGLFELFMIFQDLGNMVFRAVS